MKFNDFKIVCVDLEYLKALNEAFKHEGLIFYLKYEAPKDEQNFPMVMEMLRVGAYRREILLL